MYVQQMAEKAAYLFGGSKETQAQKDCKFGSGNETKFQLDARSVGRLVGGFGSGNETQAQLQAQWHSNDDMIPFPRARVLAMIKRKQTIDIGALYKALKRQHNRDKNEKRKFIKFNTLLDKFNKRKGTHLKWVRDNVIVGKRVRGGTGDGGTKFLTWKK